MQGIHIGDEVMWSAGLRIGRQFLRKVAQREKHAEHVLLVIIGIDRFHSSLPFFVNQTRACAIEKIEAENRHRRGVAVRPNRKAMLSSWVLLECDI